MEIKSKQIRVKFLLILMTLLIIVSCESHHTRLKGQINEEFDIKYIGDTIFINKMNIKTKESIKDKQIKIDNEYYTVNKTDTFLYLSTKKDTSFFHDVGTERYKIEIKKINSSMFSSKNYYVKQNNFHSNSNNCVFLTCIYYDINYNITRFEVATSINFILDSR